MSHLSTSIILDDPTENYYPTVQDSVLGNVIASVRGAGWAIQTTDPRCLRALCTVLAELADRHDAAVRMGVAG